MSFLLKSLPHRLLLQRLLCLSKHRFRPISWWPLFALWALVRIYSRKFKLPSSLPSAPKVERKEQKLFQLRGLVDTKKAQVAKLERSANHHRTQMEVCLTNQQQRPAELAALQEEYRSITDGKLSPNSTPSASVVSSKEPVESCDSDLMEDDPPPPAEGQPSVFDFAESSYGRSCTRNQSKKTQDK